MAMHMLGKSGVTYRHHGDRGLSVEMSMQGCLRSIAARELPALYDAIAVAFSRVTPEDCNAFFRHRGYAI